MNKSTEAALIAYLQALQGEGMTHVHITAVVPMHTLTSLELRRQDKRWTQFPKLTLPDTMHYDQMSGMVYFDLELAAKVQPY